MPTGPITEPLSLSHTQIDDYLTCPLKYKYGHVLRCAPRAAPCLVYGAALHKAVAALPPRHARGYVMSEARARRGSSGRPGRTRVHEPRP
jgi:DNA helicase-2/ATP-dependent DNA helicase PcrA